MSGPESPREEYDDARDMDQFWAAITPASEPFKQRWFLPLLLFFVVASVPWYRKAETMGTIVAGLPVWVWTSLACSLGLACMTAFAAIRYWKDDE